MHTAQSTVTRRRVYRGRDIASILGISEGYFVSVVRTGAVPYFKNDDGDTVRGKYGIEAIAAFVRWALDKRKSDTPASRFEEARITKLENACTEQLLRIAQIKGKVSSIEDIEIEWARAVIPLRNKILSLPAYVSRMLEEKSYDEIIKILTKVVEDIWTSTEPPTAEKILALNRKLIPVTLEETKNGNGNSNGDLDETETETENAPA